MKDTFEKSIFMFALILGIGYQLYQVMNGLLAGATTTLLNILITLSLVGVLLLSQKMKSINALAFFLHMAVLLVFVYFWSEFGGLSGTVPLLLFAYTSCIILTLKGWLQITALSIYLIVFICLTEFPSLTGITVADPGKLSTLQLSIDFFSVCIIIASFLLYLKNKFLNYLKRIEHRNKQLQKLSIDVTRQTDKLLYNQEEIKSINENLEMIIEQRVKKIEARNAELEEYAFINAHLVRGPLCQIMGLANLMNQESPDPHLDIIYKKAQRVDAITRRINEIISH